MKVILTEKVRSLGNVGEMVVVSAGHARNYLIPHKMAVLASEDNQKFIADQQRRLLKKVEQQRNDSLSVKKRLDGLTLELIKRVGGNGKLFGTVTSTDLAKELLSHDIEVERRSIYIENPIKQLGEYDIKVKVFADVEAHFKVKVVMDAKQVEELKKKQAQGLKKKKEKELLEGQVQEEVATSDEQE